MEKEIENQFYDFLVRKKGYPKKQILRNVRSQDCRIEVDFAIVSEKMEPFAYVEIKAGKLAVSKAISAMNYLYQIRPQNVKYYCVYANTQDENVKLRFLDVTEEVIGRGYTASEEDGKGIDEFPEYDYFEDVERFNQKNAKDILIKKPSRGRWKYYVLTITLLVLDGLSQWPRWEFTIPRLMFLAGGIVLCLFEEREINGFHSSLFSFDRAENQSTDK